MTAQTTGQDVLDRVSEAEATCLRSSIGDEAYEEFLGGEVLTSYGKVGDLDPLFSCLTGDNFVLFGVDFTAARVEVTTESHICPFDLGREHPAEGA
jgi:hypothetical protein